jgi:hypothetical protein
MTKGIHNRLSGMNNGIGAIQVRETDTKLPARKEPLNLVAGMKT